mgnify:CR=1 FL=1
MGSSEYYLTIKQLFSESVIGYLVLFCLLFLLSLAQDWINIFLFIFPIITFSFALFFKLIEVNKWRTKFEGSPIVYNPLGSEKNNANRFNIISLLLLIFLMWIGYESFVHPQLIDTYNIFFMIIYFFLYTFSFFILFFDIWKYSHIKLKYDNNNGKNHKEVENYKRIVRFLKVKKFRMISYLNLGIFVILNGLNLLFSFLTYFGVIPGYSLHLPGTGIEGSQPLILPFTFFIGLIASPMYTIPLLLVIYNEINDLSIEQLENILKDFSKNMRILILENFKILNKHLLKDLDMDEFIKTMELRKGFREYVAQRRAKSVRDEKSTREGNGKRNLKKVNEREEESSNRQKMKKTIKQKERSIEKYSSEEENIIAPKRTKKAEEKAKEIREIIKEESKKKDKESRKTEEYHNKNIKHKKWVKKQEPGSILTIKKSKGRRTCPNCDEARKEMIHESIDKTHVIMKSPRVYGKKYKCGRCGTEWRIK